MATARILRNSPVFHACIASTIGSSLLEYELGMAVVDERRGENGSENGKSASVDCMRQ